MDVILRFHGRLAEFLGEKEGEGSVSRERTVRLERRTSIKDLFESFGVPHPEVGRIAVDLGEAGTAEVDERHLVRPGEEIDVHPAPLGADPAGSPPDLDPRFALDVHLGALARILRLLGFDVLYRNDWADAALAAAAQAEARWLLTRDRKLLMRRVLRRGYCPRASDPTEQALEVLDRFHLRPLVRPWTRCLRCGGVLEETEKERVLPQLEPRTRLHFDHFLRCLSCGQVYWEGSHTERLRRTLRALGVDPARR